jgi:hypothetical protein
METPKKVTVMDEPQGPTFIYRWRDWGMIFLVVFGIFFAGVAVYIMMMALESGAVAMIGLPFLAIGLGIAYWGLGRSINRSEIRLQGGRMIVQHKPLPWRYNASLAIDNIASVCQETYFNRSRERQMGSGIHFGVETDYRNERLAAYTKDGQAHILIPKMELAAAKFLEQEIEIRLGIRQAMAEAEQKVALESARQEQRRSEAASVRSLIPIVAILGILLMVGGIWLVISTYNNQRLAEARQSWPSAVAQSSAYKVIENTIDESGNSTSPYYSAIVQYTYLVNGAAYTIEKPAEKILYSENEMAQYVETSIPAGTKLTVYYNPQKPSDAVYDRTAPPASLYEIAVFMIALGLLMIPLLMWIGREICKAEGCPGEWKHLAFWQRQVPFLGHATG